MTGNAEKIEKYEMINCKLFVFIAVAFVVSSPNALSDGVVSEKPERSSASVQREETISSEERLVREGLKFLKSNRAVAAAEIFEGIANSSLDPAWTNYAILAAVYCRYKEGDKGAAERDLKRFGEKLTNAHYREYTGYPLLRGDDFLDYRRFLYRLTSERSSRKLRPSKWIWKLLEPDIKDTILDLRPFHKLDGRHKPAVANALNDLLKRRDLYNDEYFSEVQLGNEIKSFLTEGVENLSDQHVQRFNRLILEACYPREIAKSRYAMSFGAALRKRTWKSDVEAHLSLTAEYELVRLRKRFERACQTGSKSEEFNGIIEAAKRIAKEHPESYQAVWAQDLVVKCRGEMSGGEKQELKAFKKFIDLVVTRYGQERGIHFAKVRAEPEMALSWKAPSVEYTRVVADKFPGTEASIQARRRIAGRASAKHDSMEFVHQYSMLAEELSDPREIAHSLYLVGCRYYAAKRYRKAISVFKKVLRDYSETKSRRRAEVIMGICYFRLGKMDQARKAFDHLLADGIENHNTRVARSFRNMIPE